MLPEKAKHLSGGRVKRHSLRSANNRIRPVSQDKEYVPNAEDDTSSSSDSDVDEKQHVYVYDPRLPKGVSIIKSVPEEYEGTTERTQWRKRAK
ncbi:hypothetical protein SARC_12202, partial [Sphaeroforma arctica JP610]